jgi:hypothetical protein
VTTQRTLLDELMPIYDVSDAVACRVEADPATTWEALMRADLIEVGRKKPLVGALGAIRMLPDIVAHLLHGERPAAAPERIRLVDLAELPAADGGWIALGERSPYEIALGLVGKFWRPVIEFAEVSAEQFRDFAEPGFAKTVYSLAVTPIEPETSLLSGTMRTVATDEHARRWFRRYWTFGVGSGAHVLVSGLLEVVRDDAESGSGQER